jgi:hypothetical protein
MALKTHYLPSGRLQCFFGDVDVAMFQGAEGPCELILYIVGIQKKT